MDKLDYEKISAYAQKFNEWKKEFFPKQEYACRNEACSAFAYTLSQAARRDLGMEPQNIWCYKSNMSEDLFTEMKNNAPEALKGVSDKSKLSGLIVARVPGNNASGIDYLMWREHHVAMCLDLPIYQNSQKTERLVFDPVLFSEPVREKDWILALNTNQEYTQVTQAEKESKELNLKARLMLKNINLDRPVNLLKSPLMILANRERRQQTSQVSQRISSSKEK